MKTIFVSLILTSLLFSNVQSQTLQTYIGVYEDGKATYQYYENASSDRIYEGSFKLVGKIYSVMGQYKEDLKTGTWTILAKNKYLKNQNGKLIVNSSLKGNFREGNYDGLWNYSSVIKNYNPKTRKYNTKAEKFISSALFKDNLFVGKFTSNYIYVDNLQTTGQFNQSGYADGVWITKSKTSLEEITYKDGVELSKLVKNLATGEKITYYNTSDFQKDFWEVFDRKTNIAVLNDKMYFIDTIEFAHPSVAVWTNNFLAIDNFGSFLNPLFYFQRGMKAPKGYEIKIIECEKNSTCHDDYQKRKNEEKEKQYRAQLEAEKIEYAERIERERLAQIEREKEEKRIQEENALSEQKIADSLISAKNYKEALKIYSNIQNVVPSADLMRKINESQTQIAKIDSLHAIAMHKSKEIENIKTAALSRTNDLELPLKNKKKVYAKNYLLCIDQLKKEYADTEKELATLNNSYDINLNEWTETDDSKMAILLKLDKIATQMNDFQNSVADAITQNNKAKLRILNSSINPTVIISDLINYKN